MNKNKKVKSKTTANKNQTRSCKNDMESTFIIPTLDLFSTSPTSEELPGFFHFQHSYALQPRNHLLPSLEPPFLTSFNQSDKARSSRFNAVLADMKEVMRNDPFSKFVIFSSYCESLRAFHRFFSSILHDPDSNERHLDSVVVDSKSSPVERKAGLSRFIDDPNCNICLLHSGLAASGLTLTIASVCYIIEPMQNAAEEAQALSRVHRIGQVHNVRCVVFFARDTVEERLLALRQKNKMLSEHLVDSADLLCPEEEEAEGEDSGGSGGKAKLRKNGSVQAVKTLQSSSKSSNSSFFTASNLQLLYGVPDHRLEFDNGVIDLVD
jgi:hypothetical protein